ncbi:MULTISPECIES: response regulator [unclassified Rhizobacter]|uniref:response regulator n=1 Tax=unclassified Rhizobacter TaxID=2640088 RepID=UPI0006F4D560|nr:MULTISPECIES: response regulator transcription factor [unclassified Rhizobacter]KQU65087.1 two-component system response regulator [Rhizobacter sp. Root29]KQW00682.1 two-component system response regulator [Rhizobacter sp. Root1238]KRB09924.1 two-component system response regulator [Rhizobacter sp. Root16D2]
MPSVAPARPRVLVVDDDPDLRASLDDALTQSGFDVSTAGDGVGLHAALDGTPHALVLLDLRLKDEHGLALARGLRERHPALPIIMISGSSDEMDRVLLLELAADDFLVKPFSPRELLAHVRAVLRRTQPAAVAPQPREPAAQLQFGDWTLDLRERELRGADGGTCALTPAEFRLLEAFVGQPGKVWTRDQLLEHTRSLETEVFDRSVDVLILRVRRKIEPNPKHPRYICTERGLGYVFAVPVTTGHASA